MKNTDDQHDIIVDANYSVMEQGAYDKPQYEREADEFAADYLVPRSELYEFTKGVRPLYSKAKIIQFASRLGVHPGIVVGQLQHAGEISYAHSRDLLDINSSAITEAAVSDGWGHAPTI